MFLHLFVTKKKRKEMKPKRIFIVRHGQSEGNVDKKVYNQKPDYAVKLTSEGESQARFAGSELCNIIKASPVGFYVSPYYRTRATYAGIRRSFENSQVVFYREDPRLREHEWAAQIIDAPKEEWEATCKDYGVFFFRFPTGESAADAYLRICSFWQDFRHDWQDEQFPENIVIVGHGMLNRLLLMRVLNLTVEEFELLANPKNCEIYELALTENENYQVVRQPRRHSSLRRKY